MRQEVQDKSGQFHFSRVEETSRTFFANFESTFNALESLYKLISQFFFGSQVFFMTQSTRFKRTVLSR